MGIYNFNHTHVIRGTEGQKNVKKEVKKVKK